MPSIPIDPSKKTAIIMPHAEFRDKTPEGMTYEGLIHTLGIAGALTEGKAHKFQKVYCDHFLGSIQTAEVIMHATGCRPPWSIVNKGSNMPVKDVLGVIARGSSDDDFVFFISSVRVMEQVGEIYRIKTKDETAMKMNGVLFILSCDKWGDFENFQNTGDASALVCGKRFYESGEIDIGVRDPQKLMEKFETYFYNPKFPQRILSTVLNIPAPDLREAAKILGNILQFQVKTK